jgi:hypothetical protein
MPGDTARRYQGAAGPGRALGARDHVASDHGMVDGLVIELVIILRQEAPDDEVPTIELEPVECGRTPARRPSGYGSRRACPSRRWPWVVALTAGSVALSAALGVAVVSRPAPRPATVIASLPAAAVGSGSATACSTRLSGCTTEQYRSLVGSLLATVNTIPRDCRLRAGGCSTEEYRTDPTGLTPRPTSP